MARTRDTTTSWFTITGPNQTQQPAHPMTRPGEPPREKTEEEPEIERREKAKKAARWHVLRALYWGAVAAMNSIFLAVAGARSPRGVFLTEVLATVAFLVDAYLAIAFLFAWNNGMAFFVLYIGSHVWSLCAGVYIAIAYRNGFGECEGYEKTPLAQAAGDGSLVTAACACGMQLAIAVLATIMAGALGLCGLALTLCCGCLGSLGLVGVFKAIRLYRSE